MENCIASTRMLLNQLKIRHTRQFIEDNILSHADYPSLLCIKDTLEKYQIENFAIKLDTNKLEEVPVPFIAQIDERGTPLFLVVSNISAEKVSYYNDAGKIESRSKEKFIEKWTGVCLFAEGTSQSKEPEIERRLADKRIMNVLKFSVLFLFSFWVILEFSNSEVFGNTQDAIYIALFTLFKLVGLGVGILLLWFEVDEYNPTLQSFCSGGNKVDCNAVLKSKHAQLFNGNLSISLLSFSYFFASFFYLLILDFAYSALALLSILSFAASIAILFSAYYQAIVIRQWCKFCIIIQVILVLEIFLVLSGGFDYFNLSPGTFPMLIALFLLPIVGWKLIKPLMEKGKETNLYKRGLKKIKGNPNVLHGLLAKSKEITTPIDKLGITLKNSNAKFDVVKVCNPYCGPCAKAHPILEELVDKGIINLQILFTAMVDDNDIKAKPVGHFLALDAQGDKAVVQKAMGDWYGSEKLDYESFAVDYPLNGKLEDQNSKIEAMRQWCNDENITHTPTIFIDKYELPREYSVEDLMEVLA